MSQSRWRKSVPATQMMIDGPMPTLQPWFRSQAARAFIALRYVPALAILNTVWEIAQLSLYTLWEEGSLPSIAYAVLHCTLGDVAIGTLALVFALIATRAGSVPSWSLRKVGLIAVIAAVGYTVFSEWMNTVARAGWEYSALMPLLRFGELEIGLSPLLQWVVIPPLALWLAKVAPCARNAPSPRA